MQEIKTKDVVAYAVLPRIIPRAKTLFLSGFGYIAFLMAQIYAMARLLPPHHPYLNPANMGRFGIYNVIIEASHNLKFEKKNADQIFIFFAMLLAIVVLVVQIIILGYSLLTMPVFASPFDVGAKTPTELSYQILLRIFGVPGVFCSWLTADCPNVAPAVPWSFHTAMQDLFAFYSLALLLIGALIFAYFIVVIVLETATTGTPFGNRFQNVWVPIRLVMAIGLLLPMNFGLNSAQYITLYTAKYGAAWATNSWRLFNKTMTLHPVFDVANDSEKSRVVGEKYSLLAIPQQVDLAALVASMSLVHACAYAYLRTEGTQDVALQGGGGQPLHYVYGDYNDNGRHYKIKPYLVKTKSDWMDAAGAEVAGIAVNAWHREPKQLITAENAVTIQDAAVFYFGGDILIRFGEYAETPFPIAQPMYPNDEGGVRSYCGDIRIPVTTLKGLSNPAATGGAIAMLEEFYKLIMKMWFSDNELRFFARSYVTYNAQLRDEYKGKMCGAAGAAISGCGTGGGFPACAPVDDCAKVTVNAQFKALRIQKYKTDMDAAIRKAWATYVKNSLDPDMGQELMDCGWACAGAWFNKIAEINGTFIDGVRNIPVMDRYPLVMEQVRESKKKQNVNVPQSEQFEVTVKAGSGKDSPNLTIDEGLAGMEVAKSLNAVYKFWSGDSLNASRDDSKSTGNPFIDVMHMFFGTEGLVNMRGINRHMHPLAQLVAAGKSLVDASVRNIALSTTVAFAGGFFGKIGSQQAGEAADAMSKMILSMAFLGLMAGFVLFYVLPFLPFVYFFFAVGTWVKTIFEAMVGTPLWALAHLRIDGEGLPGEAASNGYFLLLEIFIRPMLSIFGLVAAITIFGAQVHVLNIIWDLVLNNLTGFVRYSGAGCQVDIGNICPSSMSMDYQRGVMDQFFFTIIYAIVCYMLALASFKLIDQIPNNILRWAGVGVSAFGDMNAEQADALGGYISRGGQTIGQDAADLARSGGLSLGGGLGSVVKGMSKSGGG